jgi:ASC-1-like (ASCH) protein
MNYNIDINDTPFKAIKAGTKKIENRVPTSHYKFLYSDMKVGDTITLTNNVTDESMIVDILGVRHYKDFRELLIAEGTRNALSSGLSIEDAVKRFDTFEEYKENIPKLGVYAIEIKLK